MRVAVGVDQQHRSGPVGVECNGIAVAAIEDPAPVAQPHQDHIRLAPGGAGHGAPRELRRRRQARQIEDRRQQVDTADQRVDDGTGGMYAPATSNGTR